MKKFIVSMFIMLGFVNISPRVFAATDENWTVPTDTNAECKYSVIEALEGTKTYVISGFIPKKTSQDGNRVMGMVLFHNPKNHKQDSVDAVALAVLDKNNPDVNQVILLVSYYHETTQTTTTYKRQFITVNGNQTLTQCFEKTIEKVNQ